jgi:proteasome lid subunit RPN8/RPN11
MNEIHVQQMMSHCIGSAPEVACGILTVDSVLPCENVEKVPHLNCYKVPSAVIYKLPRGELRGFFHSHVNSPAIPTERDLLAANWFGYVYCILGVYDDTAREFRLYRLEGTPSAKFFTAITLGSIWDKTR